MYLQEGDTYVKEVIYCGIKRIAHDSFSPYLVFPFSSSISSNMEEGRLTREIIESLQSLERERMKECCSIIAERRGLICIEKDLRNIWSRFPLCKELVFQTLFEKVLKTPLYFEFGVIFQYWEYGGKNIISYFIEDPATLILIQRERNSSVSFQIKYTFDDFDANERLSLWQAALREKIYIHFGFSSYSIYASGKCIRSTKIPVEPGEIGRKYQCFPKFNKQISVLLS
jgi:hypothetical protein